MKKIPHSFASIMFCLLVVPGLHAQDQQTDVEGSGLLADAKRVVFLGDSITYSGQFVAMLELFVQDRTDHQIEFLNLGLPSETVSGLSEPGHAGGRFPRPDLHERLDRVLETLKPDLVIANYGMNCGIYYPYSDERFDAFRNGMQILHDKVVSTGASIVHVTPPVFDAYPAQDKLLPRGQDEYRKGYIGYDEVLSLYSAWLLAKRADGWLVADLHGPMKTEIEKRRAEQADFIFAKDGVHIDIEGHYVIANRLIRYFDFDHELLQTNRLKSLPDSVKKRLGIIKGIQQIHSNYWLNEIGHERPGMAAAMEDEPMKARLVELKNQLEQTEPIK